MGDKTAWTAGGIIENHIQQLRSGVRSGDIIVGLPID